MFLILKRQPRSWRRKARCRDLASDQVTVFRHPLSVPPIPHSSQDGAGFAEAGAGLDACIASITSKSAPHRFSGVKDDHALEANDA